MKFLIVALGNIGIEYEHTRHNIGFTIADSLAKKHNFTFTNNRLAYTAEYKIKGKTIVVIKPTTYMNLSGNAVRYYLQQEKINLENLLVLVDEIALPFGKIKINTNGSSGGHNGLAHIETILQTKNYNRLRFGIGNNFLKGKQVDYVLGKWSMEESALLPEKLAQCILAIESFVLMGIDKTMNEFNKKT